MTILPIDAKRYGSEQMRALFDEEERMRRLLLVEVEVAKAQAKLGLIPTEAAKEIEKAAASSGLTLRLWREKEKEVGHEVGALVELLHELCSPAAKPYVHYGLTSNDVLDTATSLQVKDALALIEQRISKVIQALCELAVRYKDLPAAGRTHGQYASIIPFGLRFAVWADEFRSHLERARQLKVRVLLCKTLGPVGTGSLMGIRALRVQREVARNLGLRPVQAATQVIARERMAELMLFLALLSSTAERVAVTLRLLQRAEVGEVEEPFGEKQMGSSAIPSKRNPVRLERVTSHARLVRSLALTALENVALWEERDLSNSANERIVIPMCFIITEDALIALEEVLNGLRVFEQRILENVTKGEWSLFAEGLLGLLLKRGMPRSEAYRLIQRLSWRAREAGGYLALYEQDEEARKYFTRQEIRRLLNPRAQIAPGRRILELIVRRVRATSIRDAHGGRPFS
ncbi:MAG: adenylosuccinate lyase [Nitrososphaerota archaeon]